MNFAVSSSNSIDISLLRELHIDLSTAQATSLTSGQSEAKAGPGSTSDTVTFSEIAQLFRRLQALCGTNAADLAASQLLQAASDPSQADFLLNLTEKLQRAYQDGSFSEPSTPELSNNADDLASKAPPSAIP